MLNDPTPLPRKKGRGFYLPPDSLDEYFLHMSDKPIQQYVSKKTFDEVWQELQTYKAKSHNITVVGFDEVYKFGVLHDRIRQLEAENECLRALMGDPMPKQ